MNNGKAKYIYFVITTLCAIIFGLIIYIWTAQGQSIAAVKDDFENHQVAQTINEKTDIEWKAKIDSRLANIERALKIDNQVQK